MVAGAWGGRVSERRWGNAAAVAADGGCDMVSGMFDRVGVGCKA